MTRQKRIDKNLLYVFLSVPLLSSIMSAIHLINMVELGNPAFMAVALAITFELGSIVSFVAMSKNILKRLKKEALYFIFILLFLLQSFGNVYSSFDYIRRLLLVDPTWLDSFREMFFNVMDVTTTKLTLACLIGLPIPLISLVLLKSAIDYFSVDDLPEPSDSQPKNAPAKPVDGAPEFDSMGNIKGAKTYNAPAIIAENAVMSANDQQPVQSTPKSRMPHFATPEEREFVNTKQDDQAGNANTPVIPSQTERRAAAAPVDVPSIPEPEESPANDAETVSAADNTQTDDEVERVIAPNNYEQVKKEIPVVPQPKPEKKS